MYHSTIEYQGCRVNKVSDLLKETRNEKQAPVKNEWDNETRYQTNPFQFEWQFEMYSEILDHFFCK